ncbi:ABC transporter substrate-binding protein [Geminicoccus roseus]|uniref:ABC transporter substrate-binding protein n=1 Tax=Geminicoccus roseus TaxID=404900 RepID=UPI000423B773|nr:extracellular solute-binding protein [Geminicoccus roseus]
MGGSTRRTVIGAGMGLLAGTAFARYGFAAIPTTDVPEPDWQVESGAVLRVLRPAKFVPGDETLWLENTKKFSEKYGVEVRVDSESWEDLRPKTAVAANVGAGPDVVLAWQEDPQLFADKLVPLDDLTDYLGKKYGGWFPVTEVYGKKDGTWIAMPVGGSGSTMVYRKSWAKEAGFDEFPKDFPGFLKICQGLSEIGHPPGFAFGAIGDGGWTDTMLWGYDSSVVDENDKVVIDNPRTIESLNYVKELYKTFIPGTLSWLDPSNNKAFLAGEIGLTANGISIYYAAKASDDPAVQAIADDIGHADFPIGPVGKPTQGALCINAVIFKHSKYPNAAKQYLRFMMEEEQYVPWQIASNGYWCHPLAAYDANEIWTSDPKHTPYRDVMRNALPQSYKGTPGEAASAVRAEGVVLQMYSSVVAGDVTAEEAAAEAQRRAQRFYDRV